MRPKSILIFERLFWAGIALEPVGELLSFGAGNTLGEIDPATGESVIGTVALVIIYAIWLAISFLLWFQIAHRASNVAKWLNVALTAIGISFLPFVLGEILAGGPFVTTLSLLASGLAALSLPFLFRHDARHWFATGGACEIDPRVFS